MNWQPPGLTDDPWKDNFLKDHPHGLGGQFYIHTKEFLEKSKEEVKKLAEERIESARQSFFKELGLDA